MDVREKREKRAALTVVSAGLLSLKRLASVTSTEMLELICEWMNREKSLRREQH